MQDSMHFIGQLWMHINGLRQAHRKPWSLDGYQTLHMEKEIIYISNAKNEIPIIQPPASTVSSMQ
jgi:hypothetical protein